MQLGSGIGSLNSIAVLDSHVRREVAAVWVQRVVELGEPGFSEMGIGHSIQIVRSEGSRQQAGPHRPAPITEASLLSRGSLTLRDVVRNLLG